jgi:hypothetical protein
MDNAPDPEDEEILLWVLHEADILPFSGGYGPVFVYVDRDEECVLYKGDLYSEETSATCVLGTHKDALRSMRERVPPTMDAICWILEGDDYGCSGVILVVDFPINAPGGDA